MNAKIVITKELLEEAREYVPLAEKEAWVAENAPRCFDRLAITADDEPVPPMYMINTARKSRYLMAALIGLYFGKADWSDSDIDDQWLIPVELYDLWAGSHVFNQLERWKRDNELKYKAYDLLYDYKDLEKRFSTQISGLLNVQNDTVIRQAEYTRTQMKDLPLLLEQLKELQEKKDGE